MGGRLVQQAFHASFLATYRGEPFTSNERQILVYMCSVASDTDTPPRYWGGREALAEVALGRRVPSDADDAKARRSIFESVRQAVQGLTRRGAIELAATARPGRNQEYVLTVDNSLRPLVFDQAELGPSAS
ncbi:hypothetical protein [Agromyces badenianii]|uniref:hypothetical protein n=1 Tax=Agromyces badenianii TaxID=2080742 RepID=UPI000D59B7DB|nr:hypothetical protein [Agromyces badenianii]PWC04259.1 hypothetical protein DCE94_08885 [Agromyces badenianii]